MMDEKKIPLKNDKDEIFSDESDQDVKLSELFSTLLEQKLAIFSIVVLATVITLLYSLTLTPVFRSEILLIPAEQSSSRLSGLAGAFGGLADLSDLDDKNSFNSVDTLMAILESRTFTNSYVREKNLMPILFSDDWDSERGDWKDPLDPPTMWEAHFEMKDIIKISRDSRTDLITVAVEWTDPFLAAEWANDIVKKLNDYMRFQVIEESKKSIGFLEEQLLNTSQDVTQTLLYELIQKQTNNAMLATVRDEYSFRVIDPAVPAPEKFKPHRKLIVAYGFVFGLFFGIMYAFVINIIKKMNMGASADGNNVSKNS